MDLPTYLQAVEEQCFLMELSEVKKELGKRSVSWNFTPKRAHWYGEFWEWLNRLSIKKVL